MSSLEFGKLEVNTEKSIRETDEEIIVPAILERESILQYDEGMGYRSAEELQEGCLAAEWYSDSVVSSCVAYLEF